MLRNYLLTAWRNLGKNKLTASINVLGLSVAFTCCILLFLMVRREFSYDGFHTNADKLYKVYSLSLKTDGDVRSSSMAYPAAPTFKAEAPGIVKSTPILWGGSGIRYHNKEIAKSISLVSPDFFSMFSFPVVAGNSNQPLGSLNDVVINETVATALFGKTSPIGKAVQVKLGNEWKELTVSAVLKNAPDNSTLQYQVLARIEINNDYPASKNNWNFQHHSVYVQLAPQATQQQVENQLRNILKSHHLADEEGLTEHGYRKDAKEDSYSFRLAALNTLHFDEELGTSNSLSKTYLYTLMLIAIVVLVIACFNFINLNVARSLTRAKEVGVRKTIGAGKPQIFLQLWIESFLLCVIAVIISITLSLLLLTPFNNLFTEKLTINSLLQPLPVLVILGGIILVSFLAGGYPAAIVSRFNAVEVLKGKFAVKRSSGIRNSLIVFQFVMSSLLICSTLVIYSQFSHLRNAPLGYEQETVISIPVKNEENAGSYLRRLRMELASNPEVTSVSASTINLGIGQDGGQAAYFSSFSYKGKAIMTGELSVDYDYIKTTGIRLLAGREFSTAFPSDTSAAINSVIVTESMAKQLSDKDVIGLTFHSDSTKPQWRVVGVIPDFHLYSMHEKVRPLTLHMGSNEYGYLLVKVKTANPRKTLSTIQDTFKKIEPDNTYEASFLSENTLRWYKKEQRLSNIFCTAAVVAIILSCLGLFAIVSLVMEQRRKEIGVRKVLGASISVITSLLSKEFLLLVLIAFMIAVPIGWYFLHQWLENFQYHIHLHWWIFMLAGFIMLLITVITISIQTMKAAMVNPVQSLRSE